MYFLNGYDLNFSKLYNINKDYVSTKKLNNIIVTYLKWLRFSQTGTRNQ